MMASNHRGSLPQVDRAAVSVVVLVLLSAVVMGFNLGGNSLHNDDEAKHAIIARTAATQGHWLPLTYNGKPYYSKPPLRIWLTAFSFRLAGVNEWTVRLWSAIFGLGTVLALYLLGRRLWSSRLAFLAALILLTSHQYIYNHCVRTGETDAMLIFCWTCGLLLLQLSVELERRSLLFVSAAFLGLCGVVKHLGFVPIVLLIAVGYVLLAGVWRTFSLRTWLGSLGLVGAVALPWHLAMWAKQGKDFLAAYFLGEVVEKRLQVDRASQTWGSLRRYVSLATLARGFFPWSCLLPFALADLFRSKAFRRDWLLPALWFFVAMITTVISGRKFTWYVLPAFPAAAILVARLVDRFLGESRTRFVLLSVLLGGLAALTSVTDAATHNPFDALARREMLSVDFLARLRGPETSVLTAAAVLVLVAVAVVLGLVLLGRQGKSTATPGKLPGGLILAIFGLAMITVMAPLRFSTERSAVNRLAIAAAPYLEQGEVLHVALPERKMHNPRFRFYFGAGEVRRVDLQNLASEASSGKLVLTDWKSLGEIGIEEPLAALAEANGQVLLRWPE